jgi:putative transposase
MADGRDRVLFRNRYRIASARLPGWDYASPGMYFVTLCTQWRDTCLGKISEGKVELSSQGLLVVREWQDIPEWCPRATLDAWIVMPDHLHGIVILGPEDRERTSLSTIIGQFKSRATKAIRRIYRAFDWQERFDDRILRDIQSLERARAYIQQNPQRWEAKWKHRHKTSP